MRITKSQASTGCLIFLAIPFICTGVGVSWWSATLYQKHVALQSWTEVPATITSAELKTHVSHGRRGRRSTSYEAIATYDYEVGGRKHWGSRVDLVGKNGTSAMQRKEHAELKRHLDNKTPFRCYTNPMEPSESVLYRELPGESLLFLTLFAALFGSVGLGMLTAAVMKAWRSPSTTAEVPEDQPWLARADWADGRILTSSSAFVTAAVIGVIAIYWNIAALPLYRKLFTTFASDPGGWKWLATIFPLVGVLLVAGAIHQLMRNRRFGESVLQLASTPGLIGGQLAGVVRIERRVESANGFRLLLSCIQTTGSGKQRRESTIWQDEQLVMQPMHDEMTGATAIPVLLAIPYNCIETSRPDAKRSIRWRLDATATLPGVNYKSCFEVPVFKTSESRPDFKLDTSLIEAYAQAPNESKVLAEVGINKEILPNGVRLDFGMARNLGLAICLTAFLLAWSGVTIFLWSNGSMIMAVIFGLFALLFAAVTADLWFHRSVVETTRDQLTIRGGLLGFGPTKSFNKADIKRLETEDGMTSGAQVWKNVVVVPHIGKKRTIAKSISSKLAADTVVNELNAVLGLNSREVERK